MNNIIKGVKTQNEKYTAFAHWFQQIDKKYKTAKHELYEIWLEGYYYRECELIPELEKMDYVEYTGLCKDA